jgi:putative ABC transport system permease protein
VTLYRARLRQRWVQELLAVAGIAVGVALIYASQVANTSMGGPVRQLNRALVGSSQLQLVARGPDGFPQAVAGQLRSAAIRRAAPVLQAPGSLVGPRGRRPVTLVGADPRTIRLRGGLLRTLTRGLTPADAAQQRLLAVPAPIARAIGVRFGDRARLEICGRAVSVAVAVIGRGDAGPLLHAAVAVAALDYLQDLAHLRGRVSRVLVEARPGQIGRANVLLKHVAAAHNIDVRAADYEERVFSAAAKPTHDSTMVAGLICGLVGFLFAFCAMLVTTPARRALTLELRLDGFTPGAIARLMITDALALGVVAAGAGLALGEALSRHGFAADIGFLSAGFPVGNERIVTVQSIVVGAASGVGAALVGVMAPLMRAPAATGRTRRIGAGAMPELKLAAGGSLAVALAFTCAAAAPTLGIGGLFVLVVAVVLLLPACLRAAIGALAAASRARRRAITALELSLPNLRAGEGRTRALAIAATGAVAVLGAVSLHSAQSNLQAGLDRVTSGVSRVADVWVAPRGPGDLFGTIPFADRDLKRLEHAAGSRRVTRYRAAMLDVDDHRIWTFAPPPSALSPVPAAEILRGEARRAEALVRRGGWLTLPGPVAADLGLHVGDRFTLPAPRPLRLRVAAITTNVGWPPGAVVVNARDFARGWQTTAIGAYQVDAAAGVTPAQTVTLVRRALGAGSVLHAETAAQRDARQRAASHSGLARLHEIASLIQIAAVLAMASAMAGLLWQRRVAVARLKLDGHRTAVLWRALAVECMVLFGVGCLAGALSGLLGQVLLTRWLQAVLGFPVIVAPRIGIATTSFALVMAAAVLMVAVPGYLVARVAPSLRTGE